MSLSRLRVRLTLWYAATFTLILVLLGAGLFLAIGTQVSRRIDLSLAAATGAIARATHDLELERASGGAADAVEELHIPDRELYLFDATGRAITPPQADAWIVDAARAAATSGSADVQHVTGGSHERRLHAERFNGRSGTTYVAAAVADRPNIREQYASLIGIFGAAALAALLLVAAGGFMLARQSTVPVERSMEQMRRFMADAAHELRTPVTILRTRTELALAQPQPIVAIPQDDALAAVLVDEDDRILVRHIANHGVRQVHAVVFELTPHALGIVVGAGDSNELRAELEARTGGQRSGDLAAARDEMTTDAHLRERCGR